MVSLEQRKVRAQKFSKHHQKLLERQAKLVEILKAQGSGSWVLTTQPTPTVAKKSLPHSKSTIQAIAKAVGIWTPTGKLSSLYKK